MNTRNYSTYSFFSLTTLAIVAGLAIGSLAFAGAPEKEDDFDRMDGTGKSRKTVNVIEWENNLEIHVYPKGSLVGLALKIDQPSKDKKVMVIGYRFDSSPKDQLIRRAILGIPLRDGFKVYKDPSADDYDKIIISNNTLSDGVLAYKTDPEPKQLYPEGHPALAAPERKLANEPKSNANDISTEIKKSLRNADDDDGSVGKFNF